MNGILVHLGGAWGAVASHLWQTTLVLALFFLLGREMRRAPAGLLYAFWFAAFLKLLLPLAVFGRLAQSILQDLRPGLGSHGSAALTAVGGAIDPVTIWRAHGVGDSLRILLPAITVIWAAGASLRFRALVRNHREARRWRGRPMGLVSADLRSKLEEALSGTSISSDRVEMSEDAPIPCVIGLLRPRICVPARLLPELSATQLRAVLLHEEAHRRRREPLRSVVIDLCSSLCFFYPPATWVRRRLEHAAELLCDEQVLRAGIHPATYARALARTVRTSLSLAPPAAAATLVGPGLKIRIQRIRSSGRATKMTRHYLSFALAVGLTALGTFLPLPLLTGCGRESATIKASSPAPTPHEPALVATKSDSTPISELTPPEQPEVGLVAVREVPPIYPPEAVAKGIEGTVQVRALIGTDGKVKDATVLKSASPSLDQAALDAARRWVFKPEKQKGRAVETWAIIPLHFVLH